MQYAFFGLDNTLTDRAATVAAYARFLASDYKDYLKDDISIESLAYAFKELDKGGYESHEARSNAICSLGIWRQAMDPTELSNHWQEWIPNNSLPMAGLYDCLNDFVDMGFQLCMVANGQAKNQRDKVDKLKLNPYFEEIVISEEVGFKKPDIRIFEYALAKMGVQAEDAFFVGDHPINDYLGSKEAGFTSIWFEGFHSWPRHMDPPLSIKSLNELSTLIKMNYQI